MNNNRRKSPRSVARPEEVTEGKLLQQAPTQTIVRAVTKALHASYPERPPVGRFRQKPFITNRLFFRATVLTCVVLFAAGSARAIDSLASTLEIAHSGDQVPDANGRFGNFIAPSINSVGTVVFNARLVETTNGNSDNSGIYRFYVPSGIGPFITQLEQVVREGEPLTVATNQYQAGDVYLVGTLIENAPVGDFVAGYFSSLAVQLPVSSGNETGNSILAVEFEGDFQLIAEAGQEIPTGTGSYREFNAFSLQNINANSQTVFFSALDGTDNGSADNAGIFRYAANGLITELVRKGDPAGGKVLTAVGGIRGNDFGDIVFTGLDDAGDTALYSIGKFASTPQRLLGEGDVAPTDGAEQRRFRQLSEVRINNNGKVAFSGLLADENGFAVTHGSGLYTYNGSSTSELVREGQATPDGTATFYQFASSLTGDLPRPTFNDLGQFAFAMTILPNGGGQSSGVYRVSEDGMVKIAQRGDGYEEGTLNNFADPVLNNQGVVVFQAKLELGTEVGEEGSYTITNDILIMSDGEDYVTVAREGQQVNNRTISEIIFNNNPYGPANGFNDAGMVAYLALYTDGSRAVNVWRPHLGWRAAAGDGLWDQAGNWSFNMIPGVGSDVVINIDTDIDIQGPGQDTRLNGLTFGGGSGNIDLILGEGAIHTNNGISIAANGTLTGGGTLGGDVVNLGTIQIPTGALLEVGGDLLNQGTITLDDGAAMQIGGAFSGQGTIAGALGTVSFSGGLAADGAAHLLVAEGGLILADGTQSVFELAGSVRGSQYDAVDVGGTLHLSGSLQASLLDGFVPQAGDSFVLFQAAVIEGAFTTTELPPVAGVTLSLVVSDTQVRIEATQAASNTPSWFVPAVLLPLLSE